MARWKLAVSHYINTVKPTKWRYNEQDRESGEMVEREYIVPKLLDVRDPKCWTNRWGADPHFAEGEIIVCYPGKGLKTDIEFVGDPTPDMIPQDEEAEEISGQWKEHWAYKPDALEANYSQSLVDRVDTNKPQVVEIAGLSDLVAAIAQQQQMVTDLLKSGRRV